VSVVDRAKLHGTTIGVRLTDGDDEGAADEQQAPAIAVAQHAGRHIARDARKRKDGVGCPNARGAAAKALHVHMKVLRHESSGMARWRTSTDVLNAAPMPEAPPPKPRK